MNEKKRVQEVKPPKPQKPERPTVPVYKVGEVVVSMTPWGSSQCIVDSADYDFQNKTWNYVLKHGRQGNIFTVPGGQGIFYKMK